MVGLVLALALIPSCFGEDAAVPDISGVWIAFAADPPGRTDPYLPLLSDDGRKAIGEFTDRYGTDAPEPGAWCVPTGMPSVMTPVVGYPIEIIQHPQRVTMLAELEMQVRRIYLDGRPHPSDYPHTSIGHSIGRWEDGVLIVDTALLREWATGYWPHGEDARITERIYLKRRAGLNVAPFPFITQPPLDDAVLVIELSLTDPGYYVAAPRVTMYYQRIPDDQTLEYDCPMEHWLEALEQHRNGTMP